MDDCHNVVSSLRKEGVPLVVTLPTSVEGDIRWTEDGTHCSIIYEYDSTYKGNTIVSDFSNQVMIVCSDARIFNNISDAESYKAHMEAITNDNNGWMIWKGQRCKFIVLSLGSILKLRSVKGENGEILWFVENSADFEKLDGVTSGINIYRSYNNSGEGDGVYAYVNNSTEGTNMSEYMPWGLLIGSPTVNWYNNKRWNLSADGKIGQDSTYVKAE